MSRKRAAGGTGFGHERPGTGSTAEWLTPPEIVAAVGPFDLDPCAAVDQPWATARYQYTVLDDGLRNRGSDSSGAIRPSAGSSLNGCPTSQTTTTASAWCPPVPRRAGSSRMSGGGRWRCYSSTAGCASIIATASQLRAASVHPPASWPTGRRALQRLGSSGVAGTLVRWGPP
jgi:hypothetical protein